jgi:hypothetical protein
VDISIVHLLQLIYHHTIARYGLSYVGKEITKNLIMMSASEIVAVLISYPIKLKIKRRNAYFLFVLMILASSLLSSFTVLGP